jgi:hypothetical protein
MGGTHSVHFKVLASSGDEHFITLRYNSYSGWYTVLVAMKELWFVDCFFCIVCLFFN